jgi:hypothetical protein
MADSGCVTVGTAGTVNLSRMIHPERIATYSGGMNLIARCNTNDESTRYAWGVYRRFRLVRKIQKYSCKYTHKNR